MFHVEQFDSPEQAASGLYSSSCQRLAVHRPNPEINDITGTGRYIVAVHIGESMPHFYQANQVADSTTQGLISFQVHLYPATVCKLEFKVAVSHPATRIYP